jgi:cholinesterase
VQEHIRKFGGNPQRVTLFGQSAGAGSILHQITAYGGLRGAVPFSQAILASPGFQPFPSNFQQTTLLHRYLAELNVSTVHEARQLPYKTLAAANTRLVAASRYGQFTFAPSVDGSFVPALPSQLLLQGGFDKRVRIMTGHNAHETIFFVDPKSTTDTQFRSGLKASLPAIQDSVVNYVAATLYPPPDNSSHSKTATIGYTDAAGRNELSSSEVSFTCNSNYLARAFSAIHHQTYAYQFSIPPAYHGEDVPYVYFNGPNPRVINDTIALALQTYYTQFAITGQPNLRGFQHFEEYGPEAKILNLNITGVEMIHDPTDNLRCRWWQEALYF